MWIRIAKSVAKGGKDSFTGEFRILGGLFLVSTKGVHYSYLERLSFPPPMDEILEICSGFKLIPAESYFQ